MSRIIACCFAGLLGGFFPLLASPFPGQEAGGTTLQLTLEEAIRLTLDRAPEVLLAKAQALRSREAAREVRSLNQPQVAMGTGLAYNNGFPLSMEGSAPSLFQVGMSQSILSRKNKKLILEAEEQSKASQLDIAIVRNELAAAAALAYCELHEARKMEALWLARMATVAGEQQRIETQLQAGRVRPIEAVQAKTATLRTRQQQLMGHEQARVAAAQLRELAGIPESTHIVTTDPRLPGENREIPVDSLFKKAVEASPEIRQAEALLQAREHHVQAEIGEKYPRFDIIGQYALFSKVNNYQDYFNRFSRNNFIVGLSVQVPIFNGHRTSARVAQSRQEVEEARLRLQSLKSDLKMKIERAASALRVTQGAAELAGQEVVAAKESLQLQETLLEAGRTELKEVEAARDLVRERELAAIDSRKALFQRQVGLLRLIGAFSDIFQP